MDGNEVGAAAGAKVGEVEPQSRFFTSDGLKLHYLDWGNPTAPPLLLIHGLRDHARSWDATARALCQDWHVLALDLRGHGDSDWSPDGAYLTAYHALDLATLIEQLNLDALSIVAHSFGGSVALRYAAACPQRIRRLALVEGLGPSPEVKAKWAAQGPAQRLRDWITARRRAGPGVHRPFSSLEEGIRRLRSANDRLSEPQARHLVTHGSRRGSDGYRWKYDLRVGCFAPEEFGINIEALCRDVSMPTLLLQGANSWTSNPLIDGRARPFPQARTMVIEDAGHWLHHDQFDAFISSLREFL